MATLEFDGNDSNGGNTDSRIIESIFAMAYDGDLVTAEMLLRVYFPNPLVGATQEQLTIWSEALESDVQEYHQMEQEIEDGTYQFPDTSEEERLVWEERMYIANSKQVIRDLMRMCRHPRNEDGSQGGFKYRNFLDAIVSDPNFKRMFESRFS